MKRTISLDLRERILAAYDAGDATREEVGRRFRVSEGLVKKLLQQRRRTGEIGPRHYRSGRKPRLLPQHRERLRRLLADKPDMTLMELRSALALECTLPAIHYVLVALGLTYKKRRSARQSRTGQISRGPAAGGGASKAGGTPPSSSSSMSRRPKLT